MYRMFGSNSVFNQDIGMWNVSNVTNFDDMIGNAVYDRILTCWGVENIPATPGGFYGSASWTTQPLWGQANTDPTNRTGASCYTPPPAETFITDAETGIDLMVAPVVVSSSYTSALDAYTSWCTGLSLDPALNLNNSMINDDDSAKQFDIPFVPTLNGTSTRISHSTEGGIGVYKTTKSVIAAYNSALIGSSELSQQDLGRHYYTTNVPPAIIISAKVPVADTKSIDSRYNATTDTAVFYTQYQNFGDTTENVELALLLRQGRVMIVASGANHAPAAPLNSRTYVQLFTMNELGASKQATATNGGFIYEVELGEVLTLSSIPLNEVP
jgi:hypothetical protein